jgi:hypothetical protein
MASGREPGFWVATTFIGMAVIGAFIALSVVIGEDFAVPAIITLGIVGVLLGRGEVGRAIARRIEHGSAGATDGETQAELEDMRGRMAELEERLDFAERLLTQQREAAQLPGNGGDR